MIRKFFVIVAFMLRLALGIAAVAAIYTVIRNRMGTRSPGPQGNDSSARSVLKP